MAQTYPIVGIEDTGIHPRLEIRDLQKKSTQFSLFIRAWNKVQDMRNTEDKLSPDYINKPNSWWQMGTIHGLPYDAWSGDPDGPQKQDPNSEWGGYCYHGSALFPTWHRILVLLIEQSVVNEAIAIASELEAKDPAARENKWLQSAKELRFPFWDWTKLETAKEGIPKIFQQSEIEIANPDGSLVTVNNPLNHYRFTLKPGAADYFEYMDKWERTYRWVNDPENPTEEMYNKAQEAFSKGLKLQVPGFKDPWQLLPVDWLRAKVAGLFDYPLTLADPSYGPNLWGHFATTGSKEVYVPYEHTEILANVEESHNMVHLDIGGIGMMSVNEYAGFDPIFFLHHCNVDRIYAFWEYVYPNYSIENGWKNERGDTIPFKVDEYGTFAQDPHARVVHTTPFVPFRNKKLDYWTSDDTASLLKDAQTQKYYTYPAIQEVKVDVPYDVTNVSLREKYRQTLYNEWGLSLRNTVTKIQQFSKAASPSLSPQLLNHLLDEKVSALRNFIVTGDVPEFAFPGSYRLELYLRPEVTKEAAPIVINSVSVLGRANPKKCAACRDRQASGKQISGYMRLDAIVILYLISLYQPASGNPQDRWPSLPIPSAAALGDPSLDLDWLVKLIKLSVGIRLVQPDGTPLAVADAKVEAGATLEEAKTPRLTLHSRRTRYDVKPPPKHHPGVSLAIHLDFDEPIHHGEIEVEGGWKVAF